MNFALRRSILILSTLFLWAVPVAAFELDDVAKIAAQRAKEAYVDHRGTVPKWMLVGQMSYDQWRDIRFKPAQSLWRDSGLPFQIQFFHPGLYYDRTIAVHVIDAGGKARDLPFSNQMFDYGKNDFGPRVPKDIGFAGIRVHHPIKDPKYFDEVIVFLGATYFRAIGRDNVYGLSARGIAIDTVEPTGEEFPHFTDFWLETPAPDAKHLVILALMEGPSVTGAYRFDVTPGAATTVQVDARIFARKPVKKLGIAALTSMFFFGENTRQCFDDFRPEVHDSDGLLLQFDSGEWLWRPLDNPKRIDASGLHMHNPRGFGLIQRDRAFANYQDIETREELRPSTWVEPKGDWGDGRVELVEIPTTTELVDNIVAYWVPDAPVKTGSELSYSYSVAFYSEATQRPPAGRVLATRQDSGHKGDTKRYVVDFVGGGIEQIAESQPPVAEISIQPPTAAELAGHHLVKNPDSGGWRVTFDIKPKTSDPIELRAYLKNSGGVLTETWSQAITQ